MRRIPLTVGISLVVGACLGPAQHPAANYPPAATAGSPDAAGAALPVVRLRPGPYSYDYGSGLRDSTRAVVRDSAAWAALWGRLYAGRGWSPELPAVDFAREMVVVAALGERVTGGYGILVDSALAAADGGATIVVRSIAPGRRCGVGGGVSYAVDVARTARRDGPVTFREHGEVHECP